APLFATMAAALVLHEDVRLRRWIAVVIGFVGVLVIMRPGRESMDAMLLLILLSAASSAMNNITVKYLVRTERPNAIVALFSVYLTPLSLIPALFVWQWPDLRTLGALAGLGAIGTLAHLSVAPEAGEGRDGHCRASGTDQRRRLGPRPSHRPGAGASRRAGRRARHQRSRRSRGGQGNRRLRGGLRCDERRRHRSGGRRGARA